MDILNAIAKARFGSAKPQRIQLHKGLELSAELLCLETGQELRVPGGERTYYVITGSATITSAGSKAELQTGQLAACGLREQHTISNATDKRLVILAVGRVVK